MEATKEFVAAEGSCKEMTDSFRDLADSCKAVADSCKEVADSYKSLQAMAADLLSSWEQFKVQHAAVTSSPSTTTTPPPTVPVPPPAMPEEAPGNIELAVDRMLQHSVVREHAMPTLAVCSTKCQGVLHKPYEATSVPLAGIFAMVQKVAVLPATTQPTTSVAVHNRSSHTERSGVPLTANMVPAVRVPPHPPDRRCTTQEQGTHKSPSTTLSPGDMVCVRICNKQAEVGTSCLQRLQQTNASIGVVATLFGDTKDMMMLEQNNLTNWGESAIQDNGLLGKYNYDFDSSHSMSLGLNMKKHVLIIHGLPGTGKTGLLSYLIDSAAQQGARVLVTSPGSAAVENMVEKLSGTRLNIVRVGNPARISPSVLLRSLGEVVKRSTNGVVPGITECFGVPYYPGNIIEVCPSACRATMVQHYIQSDHLKLLAPYTTHHSTTPSLMLLENLIGGSHQTAEEVGLNTRKYLCSLELCVK